MAEGQQGGQPDQPQDPSLPIPAQPGSQPGFCSATCTDKQSAKEEIAKRNVKTSDLYTTCNLPKRFEHPHWFNGYGCQDTIQCHLCSSPAGQTFTNRLSAAGMYRNYSLNTGMDQIGYP